MQVTREDLNPCTIKLTIVCEPEEVSSGFEKSVKKIAKTLKMPGFRPGHAPKGLVESLIDPNRLAQEAMDSIVKDSLKKAIDDLGEKPDPMTRPSVNVEVLNRDERACTFTAKIPMPPIIKLELKDAKGLPIEKQTAEVSDEEIQYQIDELRSHSSTQVALTGRGVQEGDVAFVNIRPDDSAVESRSFMTIAGQTFPVLDEALMGMKVEEMKHLELEFPKNFQEKDWAGKTMFAQVTLNSASAVKLPDVTDEFAKKLNAESVEELKQKLKDRILFAKEQMVREMMIEQAMTKLLERAEVQVSDNSWEDIANRRLQETDAEVREQGKTLADYAQDNGMTLEELVRAWQEKAEIYIKRAFLIREIFTHEKMQLVDRDISRELIEMAYENQISPEEMYETLKKNNGVEELRFRAISRKVTDFLIENADIKEVAISSAG